LKERENERSNFNIDKNATVSTLEKELAAERAKSKRLEE
jgi:hypothetical protein